MDRSPLGQEELHMKTRVPSTAISGAVFTCFGCSQDSALRLLVTLNSEKNTVAKVGETIGHTVDEENLGLLHNHAIIAKVGETRVYEVSYYS